MTETRVYSRKAWAFLVYMAGDNDLETFAHSDLNEMRSLPSDDHVHVVVQFDGRGKATRRFRFRPGRREKVGEPLGEINTGDPASLTQFVTWGKEHFPAEKTALVIWNHGTGLRDLPADFDYSKLLRSRDIQSLRNELGRTVFAPTLIKLAQHHPMMRGVAIDATDRDYLDNKELKAALAAVPYDGPGTDGPRVDLLGFDACLMNALEIAYQLRGLAQFMVGSQETEPGFGWPYGEILRALAASPALTPAELAEKIVLLYAAETGSKKLRGPKESPFTQSALDLAHVESTFSLVCRAAQELGKPSTLSHSAIQKAFRRMPQGVKRFRDRDLVDLGDWCDCLRRWTATARSSGKPLSFREPLQDLRNHLQLGKGLVIANQVHGGKDTERIHGVSIYWPQESHSSVYNELDFAQSGWGRLIENVVNLQ